MYTPAAILDKKIESGVNVSSRIVDYWNERATGYSCCVCNELEGSCYPEWEDVLIKHTHEARNNAKMQGRVPRMLDLGCGPGFFSILFARMGCAVDAVDSSIEMLKRAKVNNQKAGTAELVNFHEGDITRLPFPDNSFDVVALRNVTWLMQDLEAAYSEWQRVLAPGGNLISFDANWYSYLVDPAINSQRIVDEVEANIDKFSVNGFATDDQESRCEEIALSLTTTYLTRPAWDVKTLDNLGFSSIHVDTEVWQRVWSEEEQALYASSPLFLVKAVK